ncbi:MAG: ComEC/Rec2 family competence protein [Candidatus Liptonbacteria bacterium]|nr:ComEC/Rec2 family competence protein [Candidatus Liptonbacteria bacterium]
MQKHSALYFWTLFILSVISQMSLVISNLPMQIHDIAFYFALFFLIGTAVASFGLPFFSLIILVIIVGLLLLGLKKTAPIALLAPSIILGFIYFNIFSDLQGEEKIVFDEKFVFEGVVYREPSHNPKSQKISLKLTPPYHGEVVIYTSEYPQYKYGDEFRVSGVVSKSPSGAINIVSFPEIELLESGSASKIKQPLFALKRRIVENLGRSLNPGSAALISGEILGERAGFTKEFSDAMRMSGTTHIVAISGYNISILVFSVMFMAGYFVKKKVAFYVSVVFIILFTLMAGAEASVVRAAIMGIIILSAYQFERIYSFRNALTLAAFFMALFDPRILVFDTGFQLSFGALLGIVYLAPVLKELLKIKGEEFLSWKSNAVTTLSAQLAVIPILFHNFGYFSLTSIIANVLILEVVPITMALGFFVGFVGFLSTSLSIIFGWLLNIFTGYQIFVIDLFSKLALPIWLNSFSFFAAFIYYSILTGFIYYWRIIKDVK